MSKASTVSKGLLEKFMGQLEGGVYASRATPAQLHALLGVRMSSLQMTLADSIRRHVHQVTGIATMDSVRYSHWPVLAGEVPGGVKFPPLDWWKYLPDDTGYSKPVQIESIGLTDRQIRRGLTVSTLKRVCRGREIDPVVAMAWGAEYLEKYTRYADFYSGWHDANGEFWVTRMAVRASYIRRASDLRSTDMCAYDCDSGEQAKILVRHRP